MSRTFFWLMLFFLTTVPTKKYFPSGKLQNITWTWSKIRVLYWILLGIILWKVGLK